MRRAVSTVVMSAGWSVRRALFLLVCLTVLFGGSAKSLCAQGTSATINGQITDSQGRSVPGVEVQAVNIDTNVFYPGKTNDSGIYVIPSVPPGRYRLVVLRDGFKEINKTGLVLHVQDTLQQNFALEVGSISESVTVEAGGLVINTTDASVSTVVDRQFAENLPMNGRSFQTLIQLTPGVVIAPSNAQDNGQFNINGQRASSNYWMVDGVSANIGVTSLIATSGNGLAGALGSFSALGGTNSLVSVDAMREFRIQTSTYAPEFGRTPGGQISIVTRSGTNQFHGTVFDYLRNDVLDANDWFADSKGLPKPNERQNDFGGTFSGPILKDKTFFFFSYEGLRLRLPQTALTSVPCDSTCTVFGNARTMAVSAMQPYLNTFPLPNGPEVFTPCTPNVNGCPASGQQPTGLAQFNASYSNPATLDAYSLRVDHRLSSKLSVFGRYNYSPSENRLRGFSSFSLSMVVPTRVTTQTATLGATWAISSRIVNDLRFNYSRTNSSSSNVLDNFAGAVPLTSLPFPNPYTSETSALLAFTIFGVPRGGAFQAGQGVQNLQRQINIVDGVSAQKGSHSLKFGVDFRRLSPLHNPHLYTQEVFFGSVGSAEKGNPLFNVLFSSLKTTFLFRDMDMYAQDTWRVMRRLSLTYGVRWDVGFVPSSLTGPSFPALTGFNFNNLSTLALAPAGTPPYKTTYNNFAPRVGVAYEIRQNQDRQTVLRGGFGVFYDLATSEAGNLISVAAYPFGGFAFKGGGTFPLDPATAPPPPINSASGIFGFDPHLKLPYTLEWNVALEQALGRQQILSASYVGAAGRRLLQSAFVNSPSPNFASAGLVVNAGTSSYDALQLQFQRRLSHGVQALASYTWSHSIDTASAGSTLNPQNALVPGINPNANRGPSDFDIRNSFSAGLTYDVPAPKTNAFANVILRGWSLDSFILARSAAPVYIFDQLFEFTPINGADTSTRPDLVPGQPLYLYGSKYPGGKALNPAAFTDPPFDPTTMVPLRQGSVPRNFLRGFGAVQWDFAVHREFPIHESLKLDFRAEMFNLLNHPNFASPSGAFLSPQFGGPAGFGLSTQLLNQGLGGGTGGNGGLSSLYQVGGPRSAQFALKFEF